MEAGKISYQNYTSRAMNNRTKENQESYHQQNQELCHQQNQEYSKLARYSSMNDIKDLESNTQSNLIQTKYQSQTEGLLTSHRSDLQLNNPIAKSKTKYKPIKSDSPDNNPYYCFFRTSANN